MIILPIPPPAVRQVGWSDTNYNYIQLRTAMQILVRRWLRKRF